MSRHASKVSAFATGVAVAFPALSMAHIQMTVVLVGIWIIYVASIFIFVFGPQQWETYRWVPVEEVHIVIGRANMWVLGGILSVAVLEGLNAI
jgi:hypothetical protein